MQSTTNQVFESFSSRTLGRKHFQKILGSTPLKSIVIDLGIFFFGRESA
jgi:hypothetical protein